MAIDKFDAQTDFENCLRAGMKVGSSMSYRSGKTGQRDNILILVATGRTAERLYAIVAAAVDTVAKVRSWR